MLTTRFRLRDVVGLKITGISQVEKEKYRLSFGLIIVYTRHSIVVLTLTRIIKSVVTGQAPVFLQYI